MKKYIGYLFSYILLTGVLVSCTGSTSSNGNCQNPDDIAADGSRCGGRAASVRPGGN